MIYKTLINGKHRPYANKCYGKVINSFQYMETLEVEMVPKHFLPPFKQVTLVFKCDEWSYNIVIDNGMFECDDDGSWHTTFCDILGNLFRVDYYCNGNNLTIKRYNSFGDYENGNDDDAEDIDKVKIIIDRYKPNEKFCEDKGIKKTIENSDEIETMMII